MKTRYGMSFVTYDSVKSLSSVAILSNSSGLINWVHPFVFDLNQDVFPIYKSSNMLPMRCNSFNQFNQTLQVHEIGQISFCWML